MNGDLYANAMVSSLSVQRVFRDAIPSFSDYSQTAHRQNDHGAAGFCSAATCDPNHKWITWNTPFLQRDTRERTHHTLGYDLTARGFAAGITRLLGDSAFIGLAAGYDSREQKARDNYFQKLNADTFHSAIYGGAALGHFDVDVYAGYSWSSKRTHRFVPKNAIWYSVNNNANFNDGIWSSGIKGSYTWILPSDFRIVSTVGIDYSYLHQNEIQEQVKGTGSHRNRLTIDSADYHSVQTPVTLAINKTFASDFLNLGGIASLWTPEVRAGWIPQFGSKHASVNATTYDVETHTPYSFVSQSAAIGGVSHGTVGAGLKIQIKDRFTLGIDYDYRFGKDYRSHVLAGTCGISF